MAKKVTVINAISQSRHAQLQQKLRVCAYARVSTDSRSQAESYATQVEYYTEKIKSNPLWKFIGVYADEGITGTKEKGRDDFRAMIEACEEGEIDLILTKSIARFARNTVECIQAVRKLKAIGVGIHFEKENINTLTESSELMLTILASVAQGESEDFAGNNRWAVISRFENGTFIVGTPAYGYRKDKEGNLIKEKQEAEVVRWIFDAYLSGMGAYVIAKRLNENKIPTIRGSEKWKDGAVLGILQNEVYEGNTLRQKKYTENQFPFTRRVNYGQVNMYLTKDAHPSIITHEEALAVRSLMQYRNRTINMDRQEAINRYLFSGRIVCGECGEHFRRQKVYIDNTCARIIWTCRKHVEDKAACHMRAIREEVLYQAFVNMWNKLYTNQGTVLEPLLRALVDLTAGQPNTEEIEKLNNEIQMLSEQSRILNQVMRKGYMDSALFIEKNNLLTHRLSECRKRKTFLTRKQKRIKEITKTEQFIELLKQEGYQREFREALFCAMVDEIQVSLNREIHFQLKNGLVLTEREGDVMDAVAYSNRI